MTTITLKTGKQYIGFCNGKNYAGTIYVNGLSQYNGYLRIINGNDDFISQRKSIAVNIADIDRIEADGDQKTSGLPKTVGGWMKLMEKAG